jgi:hypothetical protein
MKAKQLVLLAALVGSLLLLSAGLTLAGGAPGIGWSVVGGSGGSATAGNNTLESVIGQWAASGLGQGPVQLASGFLGGARLGSPTAVTLAAFTARVSRQVLGLGGLALIALGSAGLAWTGRRAWRGRHLKAKT